MGKNITYLKNNDIIPDTFSAINETPGGKKVI